MARGGGGGSSRRCSGIDGVVCGNARFCLGGGVMCVCCFFHVAEFCDGGCDHEYVTSTGRMHNFFISRV